MSKFLCGRCEHSIFCDTWGEYKCMKKNGRMYCRVSECDDYKARDKNFKESKCQCDDCLSQVTEEA